MPRYITTAKLTASALKGMIAKPEDRRDAIAGLVAAAGGELIDYYLTTGDSDLLVIVDAPNDDVIAKVTLITGASGMVTDLVSRRAWSTAEFAKVCAESGPIVQEYRMPGS
ncbi:MAG: GYD domain-containing protein [Pseudomonadota bacterium]